MHVDAVPAAAAAAVIQRVARLTHPAAPSDLAAPLIAFGLMQHEGKMSVMHGGVKKVATYSAPICNKEKLLIVTGERRLVFFRSDWPFRLSVIEAEHLVPF